MFGAPKNTFGQSTSGSFFGQSAFAKPTNTFGNNTFGQQNQTVFGAQPATGLFGTTAQQTPAPQSSFGGKLANFTIIKQFIKIKLIIRIWTTNFNIWKYKHNWNYFIVWRSTSLIVRSTKTNLWTASTSNSIAFRSTSTATNIFIWTDWSTANIWIIWVQYSVSISTTNDSTDGNSRCEISATTRN